MDWYYDLVDQIAGRLEAVPQVISRTLEEPQFHASEAILLTAIAAVLVILVVLVILRWALGPGKLRKTGREHAGRPRRRKQL